MRLSEWFLRGAAACAMAAPAPVARAQSAPAQDQLATTKEASRGTELETVIVTARKRSESIQSTPVAVTAVNAEMIKKLFVYDLTDIDHQPK